MKRSARMRIVVELAEREENTAAKACEEAKQAVLSARKQLHELESYYSEYQSKFAHQKNGLRSRDMQSQREFLSRLSSAKESQALHIGELDKVYEALKGKWYTCMIKRQNLEKLIASYKLEEASVENLKEQKIIDDWVVSNYKA